MRNPISNGDIGANIGLNVPECNTAKDVISDLWVDEHNAVNGCIRVSFETLEAECTDKEVRAPDGLND